MKNEIIFRFLGLLASAIYKLPAPYGGQLKLAVVPVQSIKSTILFLEKVVTEDGTLFCIVPHGLIYNKSVIVVPTV